MNDRSAFLTTAAGLVIAAAAPTTIETDHSESEFVGICRRFAEAEYADWYAYVMASDEVAMEMEERNAVDWATYNLITATPAKTLEGLRAKALALAAWDRAAYDDDSESNRGGALLASLLRDMVAPERAEIIERLTAKWGPLPDGYTRDGVWVGSAEA